MLCHIQIKYYYCVETVHELYIFLFDINLTTFDVGSLAALRQNSVLLCVLLL